MNTLAIVCLPFLAVVMANPITPSNTITNQDENGIITTDNLDEPHPVVYAADINKQKFLLFTSTNRDTPYELKYGNNDLLQNSPFNIAIPTKVLIHGWQNNYQSEAMQNLKDAYLDNQKVNVLICDYEEYNSPYFSAVGSAKKVGENIATLINFLIQQGLQLKDIHILGHSLGAHIAGYVAQVIGNIPRITGLDAAGPLFNGNKPANRLSSDDAEYVECIHTSASLGMTNLCGVADFYPHGGDRQPTCLDAAFSGGCDHAASYRYYAQSIANKNAFPARTCASESEAQSTENSCADSDAVMGE